MKHAPERYLCTDGRTRILDRATEQRVDYHLDGESGPGYSVRASSWAALIRDAERIA